MPDSLNQSHDSPDETLFRALGLAHVPDLDPSRLTQSEILGVRAPASTIIQLYAARLGSSATPLRDALETWQQTTALTEEPATLAEQLARADSLPLELQRAVALLILSTADATRLQNRAVASLSDEEFAFLVNALLSQQPNAIPAPGEEEAAASIGARVDRLSGLVDLSQIMDGARLMAAAISQAAPALEAAGTAYSDGAAAFAPIVGYLSEFYRAHPPSRVNLANDYDRLSLVVDYVKLIAQASQPALASTVEPAPLEQHARLSDALMGLAGALHVPIDNSPARAQLGSADALPQGLQAALSRLVRAQTRIVRAVEVEVDPSGHTSESSVAIEVLRYLETLRETYPTLATYQYLYQLGAPGVSTDPSRQATTLASLQPFLQILGSPETPLSDIVSILAYMQGETVPRPGLEKTLGRGSLGRGIAELLALESRPLSSEMERALENETASLPAVLETAAARIIWAEIGADKVIRTILDNLPDQQQAWFLGGPTPLNSAMADDWIDSREFGPVRLYLESLLQFRQALFLGGSQIGAAVDAALQDLSPYVTPAENAPEPTPGEPNASPSSPMPSDSLGGSSTDDAPSFPGFSMTTSAAGPAPPIPCSANAPSANCPADIMFLGPAGTVVITGSNGGTYSAGLVGGTRDHRLWIDLGGDDTYFTAAAAAELPAILNQGRSASVMLELAGNDQYLTPPGDVGKPKQAAAEGLGAIAMLVDDDGFDLYRSDGGIGQAAASGLSLALLIDNAGNDERIVSGFDARGQAFSTAPPTFFTQPPVGGVSLLLDREQGGGTGADTYRVSSSKSVAGQAVAAGLGGAAFLVDAAGPDTYQGGGQAAVGDSALPLFGSISGLAILGDLAGADQYSRKTYDGGRQMRDGDCQTSAQADPATLGNGVPFLDDGNPTQPPAALPLTDAGVAGELLSVFIDLRNDSSCEASTSVPSEILPPRTGPDEFAQFIEEKMKEIQGGGLTTDSDADVWPDLLERLATNDPQDSMDSPAGLPPRPANWPENEPYPPVLPDGRRFPNATGFLVNIPGVFALGDAITTTYVRNYQFSIDLGGPDVYRNRVASDLESSHIDMGTDADRYEAGDHAQAHRGILIDAGGNDTYIAGSGSQASAPRVQTSNMDRSTDIAVLADLGGDDLFVAGPESQGFAERHCEPCTTPAVNPQRIALLLDLQGNDTYMTLQQGIALNKAFVAPAVDAMPLVLIGAVVDWQGTDHYQVSQQGRSPESNLNPGVSGSGINFIFSHFADLEGRDRHVDFGSEADRSRARNDRYDVSGRYDRAAVGGDTLVGSLRIDTDPSLGLDESFQSSPSENQDDFEVRLSGMRIAIGKSSNTTYREPYAVSVDLGGTDSYYNNAGASSFPPTWIYPAKQTNAPPSLLSQGASSREISVSGTTAVRTLAGLAFDLAGDDDYDASDWLESESNLPNRNPGPLDLGEPLDSAPSAPWAAQQPGFGRYESRSRLLSQGTGFLGVGVLVDTEGDDQYRAFRYAQGTGVVGVGILWDREGNDRYDYDGAIVADPAADGGRLVWSDRRDGRWEIYMATPDTGPPIRLTPPPDPNAGWRGDHESPTIAGDFVVWSSSYGDDWDLYRFNIELAAAELVFGGPGNQTKPSLHGGSLAFTDDAAGLPVVFALEHVDQSIPFLSPFIVSPSNQVQLAPDVFHDGDDFRVTWVELQASGQSEVWWKNVGAGLPAERIAGDAYRWQPKVFGPHLTWQQWDQSTDSWDVYYTSLDDPNAQIVAVASGPGDQREPDVVPGGVAYVDDATNQLRMWYRAGQGPCPVLRESPFGFAHPSFDSDVTSNVYAIRRGPGPTGLGAVHDVVRNSVSFCDESATVRDSQLENAGPQFLQGAGLQRGLGALVEEAGDDSYSAWDFSQGATFTNSEVSPNGPAPIGFSAEQGAPEPLQVGNQQGSPGDQNNRGLLLDIDGSDRYVSRNYGQGAHGSAVIVNQVGPAAPPPGVNPPVPTYLGTLYAAEQAGVLYDLRGRDSYHANQFAQGFAGFTVGSMILAQPPFQPGPAPPPLPRPDLSPFLISSVGLFLDSGGTDEYRSNPGDGFQMLREPVFGAGQQPSCNAHPAVPGSVGVPGPTEGVPSPRELVCQDADSTDTLPIQEMDDVIGVLNGVLATPGSAFEKEFPRSMSSDPRNNRDNTVWRQESVPGTAPGVVNAQQSAGPDGIVGAYFRRVTGAQSSGLLLTPGGIGADLSAYDRYVTAFAQAVDQFVHVNVKADDKVLTETARPTVVGQTMLSIEVDASILSNVLDLRSVEYAATNDQGTRLLGVARGRDCPEFCLSWNTDSNAWPDGRYEITARASFSPKAFAFSVGSVSTTGGLIVDNPSRIEPFPFSEAVRGVSPAAFSPQPIAFGPHPRPNQAAISFLVSRHSDGSAGSLRAEILDSGASSNAPPVAQVPGNTTADGTKYRWQGTWDGRTGAGLPVDSGRYVVRFTALDDTDRPERLREQALEVRVEAENPGITCARPLRMPQFACNGSGDIPAIAATGRTGDAANIPVGWLPDTQVRAPTDIAEYHFFSCTPAALSSCPENGWSYEPVPGTVLGFAVPAVMTGEKALVVVLAEDVFGNLEGARPGDTSVQQAFDRKLAEGGDLEMRLDLDSPSVTSEVVLRGQVVKIPFISGNTDGVIRATANDSISAVSAKLLFVNAEGDAVEVPLTAAPVASRDTVFTSSNFRDIENLKGWPGGLVLYFLTVRDQAGNELQAQGTLLLDPDAPTIGPGSRIDYPDGQAFAALGDVVEPIVVASDPPIFPNTIGSRPDDLVVTIDARELNPDLGAYVLPKFRRTALMTFFTGAIEVTVEPLTPRIVALPITVTDETGNVAHGEIEVVFGQPVFGIAEPEVVDATHETLRIRWTTSKPSLGEVRYGLSTRVENVFTGPGGAPSLDHEVELEGLRGQSNYFFRIIAKDGHGLEELGPLRTAATKSGLTHVLLAPGNPNAVYNASFLVRWETRLPSEPTQEIEYEVKIRPTDSSTFFSLARLSSLPGVHEFVVDPLEFADGAYEVNVTVRTPFEQGHAKSPPFLLDRVRPQILPELPIAGWTIVDSAIRVQARVLDAYSGVDPGSITLALNDGPDMAPPYDSTTRRASIDVESGLHAGANVLTLSATDHAGNRGSTSWHFTLDQEGPLIQKARAFPPQGQTAVKPGDKVLVSALVEDASNVQRVWIDVGNLSSVGLLQLDPQGENHFEGAFLADAVAFAATDATGVARMPIWAQDEHGFTSSHPGYVDIGIDTVAPRLQDIQVEHSSLDMMELRIETSEPVRLLLEAAGARIDPLQTQEDGGNVTVSRLHFMGGPPRVLPLRLILVDQAGHEAIVERGLRTLVASDTTPPGRPEHVTATPTADGQVRLRWDAATDDTGVDNYLVFRVVDARGLLRVGTTHLSAFVDLPPNAPNATYVVRAVDFAGHVSEPSEPVEALSQLSPSLSAPDVTPPIGRVNTTFIFRVTYHDPSGRDPQWIRLLLNGVPNLMEKEERTSCVAGCPYWFRTTLPPVTARDGPVSYSFEAKTGPSVVKVPSAGPLPIGPIVIEALPGHPESLDGVGLKGHPTPAVSTPFALAVPILLALIRALRRKP